MKLELSLVSTEIFVGDSRGLSVVAGYTLTLAITGLLIMALITGTTGFVQSESEITANNQLEIAGGTLSSEISTVHSIATNPTDTNQEVTTTVELPRETTAGSYFITVTDEQIELETVNGDVEVVKPLPAPNNDIEITSDGRISGGDVEIMYAGGDLIEVSSAS